MSNVIPFTHIAAQHQFSDINIDILLKQLAALTKDIENFAEFIVIQADRYTNALQEDTKVEHHTQSLIGYMQEMNKKTALLEQLARTVACA